MTQNRPETGAVAFRIYFGCGGRYDPDHLVGLSHALEHMIFKGTPGRSQIEIARRMEGAGASINAVTSFELTCYYFTAPAEVFSRVLNVYADAVNNPLLDKKEWEKERGVILEELKMIENVPNAWISHLLSIHLYNLRIGVIGTRETIQAIETDDMRQHINQWCRPENIIISVAGNVTHEKVMRESERHFGNRKGGGKVPTKPGLPKKVRASILHFPKKSDQVNMAFGLRTCGINDPDFYPLWVMSNILGGKMSSRLYHEVREKRGLAYFVGSNARVFSDKGYLEIKAGVTTEKALEAARVIMNEARRLKNKPVTGKELAEAKCHIRGTLLVQEQSQAMAGRNGANWLTRGRVIPLEESLEKIGAVQKEDIKRVAGNVFRSEELVTAIFSGEDLSERLEPLLKF